MSKGSGIKENPRVIMAQKKLFKIKSKCLVFTGNKSLPKIYESWCPTEEILGRY